MEKQPTREELKKRYEESVTGRSEVSVCDDRPPADIDPKQSHMNGSPQQNIRLRRLEMTIIRANSMTCLPRGHALFSGRFLLRADIKRRPGGQGVIFVGELEPKVRFP
jgi:hypothetical protein